MEVTRRKFIRKLVRSCLVVPAGVYVFARTKPARKSKLRKFVRAFRATGYPGPVKPLGNIDVQSKWSG
ncbi:MAG: hypothetical protein A2Z25_17325 [Planctomycetes bacterium RBG_16_55_9]|nr:MAG: hypothetical protein A2Z25_17325 [Planctomycetes bacterium RBG_16_55_9]